MNVKQTLLKHLTDRGMSDNQAEEVLKEYLESVAKDTNYQITLSSDSGAYPQAVYNAFFSGLNHQAVQWIEKNIPLAWFKPMFI
jgi:hypothetical protein